jgi:hypothetical protein
MTRTGHRHACVAIALPGALLLALGPGRAAAAAPAELGGQEPTQESAWSQGVPAEAKAQAETLFREGNALLKESLSISAAAKYREALARWDHPSIHYNLALALMSQDQPVETSQHLAAAMRFGPAPLQGERFDHARNYLTLLEQQLVPLTVRCPVAGARVELDGKPLFDAPGEHQASVRAGRHTVVASREGYVTNHQVRVLDGGKPALVELELQTLEQLTEVRRRWPAWMPWSVVGAGAAVALAGGAFQWSGLQKVARVDSQSKLRCPTGCAVEPSDLALARSQGRTMQRVAVGAYVAGGAALAAGAVLVVLNRSERYVRPYRSEAPEEPARQARWEVSPVLDRDAPGLVATVRF